MILPPSIYPADFDLIFRNTIFTEAFIDPQLNEEEEKCLLKVQSELIWNKLVVRYDTKHFPRRGKIPRGIKMYEMQWWED